MFHDFINHEVLLYLKWAFTQHYLSSECVKCTLLNCDNKFIKVKIDNKTHYINQDCIVAIKLYEKYDD